MYTPTQIADAIWRLHKEYGRDADSFGTQQFKWLWSENIRKTCEKFKQEQLSDPIAYLVLLHSVHEFLEKNDAKQF